SSRTPGPSQPDSATPSRSAARWLAKCMTNPPLSVPGPRYRARPPRDSLSPSGKPSRPVALLVLLARAAPAGVVSPDLCAALRRHWSDRGTPDGGRRGRHAGSGGTRHSGRHPVHSVPDDVGTALLHAAYRLRRRLDDADPED